MLFSAKHRHVAEEEEKNQIKKKGIEAKRKRGKTETHGKDKIR